MKKQLIAAFICTLFITQSNKIYAQLEFIPSLEVQVTDSPQLSGVFIFNTMDFRATASLPPQYPSSLQVVDPANPWPPLFFANSKPGGSGFVGNGIYMDVRFWENINRLSYFFGIQSDSGPASGKYYFSDTSFMVLDSFVDADYRIDPHDLQLNNAGEKLYMKNFDTIVDVSAYTGNAFDTTFLLTAQKIEIMDSNNAVIFSWNPLDFLPLSATYENFTQQGFVLNFYTGFDWSHGNSVRFAQDGNILFSFRNIGLGKVDRNSGALLWRFGGKTSDISIPANAYPYTQHDFKAIAPDIYTVFANGTDTTPCKAVVYQINEVDSTAKMLSSYAPSPSIISRGLGNFDMLQNGLCLVNYGAYASFARQNVLGIYDTASNATLAEYSLPALTFIYQAHHVPSWKPQRPAIIQTGNQLQVADAQQGVSWYQLSDTQLIHLSDSAYLLPADTGRYLATVKTGFGYLVSGNYYFSNDSVVDGIFHPEAMDDGTLFNITDRKISSRKYSGTYSVFTVNGRSVWSGFGSCDLSMFSPQIFIVKTPDGYRQKLMLTY